MATVAMQGKGANQMDSMGMSAKNARAGEPDLGRPMCSNLYDRELQARKHYVVPSNDYDGVNQVEDRRSLIPTEAGRNGRSELPHWYNNYDGLPVPYGPSEQKDRFLLESAVRKAAGREIAESDAKDGVIRTAPITETEIQYLKSMKDQAELAKFDDYVESFIDPRQPGNMKWLMEVYPDYVSRRLQQAHTDYEFALRNQMIDLGHQHPDDRIKYLVDQGKITARGCQTGVHRSTRATHQAGCRYTTSSRRTRKALKWHFRLRLVTAGVPPTLQMDSERENRPLGAQHGAGTRRGYVQHVCYPRHAKGGMDQGGIGPPMRA